MNVASFQKAHRAVAYLTASQRETFLCIARLIVKPITKRELRKLASANAIYRVPKSAQTYCDHVRKLIDLGLLAQDESDSQVVLLTPLGASAREYLIEELRERVEREELQASATLKTSGVPDDRGTR